MPFKLLVFIAELESLFYEFFPGTKQENGRQSVDQGTDTRPYETAGTEEIERQAHTYKAGQRVEGPENCLAVDIELVVDLIYEKRVGIRCDIRMRHEGNRERSDNRCDYYINYADIHIKRYEAQQSHHRIKRESVD